MTSKYKDSFIHNILWRYNIPSNFKGGDWGTSTEFTGLSGDKKT